MTDPNIGTELATIERAMGDRHSEYFSGPRIDGETLMARRYRSLIETGTADAPTAPSPEAAPALAEPGAGWASATGQQLLRDWEGRGGIGRNYEAARLLMAEAFAVVPEETQAELRSQIDGLPVGVQMAMLAGLANPYIPSRTATPAQISRFSNTPEGTELIRAWGPSAARRLATVTARVRDLVGRLSSDEAASFAHFADNISGAEFTALATYLSA